MSFCGYKRPEPEPIRQYKLALEVMKALKAEGKLDEVCKVKAIDIPLFKNIVCRVWGNTEIEYGYGKQLRKIPEGTKVIDV